MGRLLIRPAIALAAIAVLQRPVLAQQACAGSERGSVLVGIEAARNRLTWHFDNPSAFDTAALVPHFFEQTYIADNVWLTATARYSAGLRWETAGAVTPQRTATATDYDTFHDPDGSIVVSGTTGGAAVRGVRASQFADVGRIGAATLLAGYRFRLDTAGFGVGRKTITRNDALVSAGDVTTRETTRSQIHELVMGVALPVAISRQWTMMARGELSPATFGRLLIQLPDKYPGQDLVFVAKVAGTSGQVRFARSGTRWPFEVTADASRTWSYRSDARLTRTTVGVGVRLGRTW